MGTSGSCEHGKESLGSKEYREFLAEELLASQEGLKLHVGS
jgi:hypothetical protein